MSNLYDYLKWCCNDLWRGEGRKLKDVVFRESLVKPTKKKSFECVISYRSTNWKICLVWKMIVLIGTILIAILCQFSNGSYVKQKLYSFCILKYADLNCLHQIRISRYRNRVFETYIWLYLMSSRITEIVYNSIWL